MRHAHKEEGAASIHSALCYQQINKDAPSFSSLSLSLSISVFLSLVHICSAANPSNAVSLCLISRHPRHLPSPPSLSLSLSVSPLAAQVMSFFFSWILLPSPSSLALTLSYVFPLAAGSPQRSILSAVASLRGREGEEERWREV